MANKFRFYFKWMNVGIDFLLLNFSLYVTLFFYDLNPVSGGLPEYYKLNFLLLNLFWFYCSKLVGLYNNILKRDAGPTITDTVLALFIYALTASGLTIIFPTISFPFPYIVQAIALTSPLILISKFNLLALRRSKRKFWIDQIKVVVVGAGPAGLGIANYIQANPQLGYTFEGFFDDKINSTKDAFNILGKVEECLEYVTKAGVKEIYCALPNQDISRIKTLMQEADKFMVRFKMVPDLHDLIDQQVLSATNGQLPVITPRQEPLEYKGNEILKRLFDFTFSFIVVFFLLSWLIPLIGIIIKLDSKGPVFFKQLRSGKNNQSFYCFKFRSMAVNTDADSKQATKGDTRVTRVGRFLRKTSLDELPQFINVLLGDMSVVGPRPHMLKHTIDYSAIIDNYMVRHFLTPGITGWAQVNGFRGETKERESMLKRVQADIWYLENWSLLLDIKIVLLTIWQGIKGNEDAC